MSGPLMLIILRSFQISLRAMSSWPNYRCQNWLRDGTPGTELLLYLQTTLVSYTACKLVHPSRTSSNEPHLWWPFGMDHNRAKLLKNSSNYNIKKTFLTNLQSTTGHHISNVQLIQNRFLNTALIWQWLLPLYNQAPSKLPEVPSTST